MATFTGWLFNTRNLLRPANRVTGHLPRGSQARAPDRGSPRDRRSSGDRRDIKFAAQLLCSPAHTRQAVAGRRARHVEAAPVVAQPQLERAIFQSQLDSCFGAASVTHDVVHRFLEDQEELTTRVDTQLQATLVGGRDEYEGDVRSRTRFVGHSAHPLREIAQAIPIRIDGPYDIAHGINALARCARDEREPAGYLRVVLFCRSFGHLTHHRYQGEV